MKKAHAEVVATLRSVYDALTSELLRIRRNRITRPLVRSRNLRELRQLRKRIDRRASHSTALRTCHRWLEAGKSLLEYTVKIRQTFVGKYVFSDQIVADCTRRIDVASEVYKALKERKPTLYKAAGLHSRTLNVYNMPEVVLDTSRRPTVNVLVPAFDFGSMSAGFFGVFQTALYIKRCGFHVRLVHYDRFDFDASIIRANFQNYPGLERLFDELEVCYVGDRTEPLKVSPHDNCVATVWYSAYFARKIMSVCGERKFLYLIQDYETVFHPADSLFALADASYSFNYAAFFSSKALQDHFLERRIGVFASGGTEHIYFNNACSSVLPDKEKFMSERPLGAPRRLAFYSRPVVARNMFELGALALCEAWQQGVFAEGEWEFIGIGLGEAIIELAPGVRLNQMERMNLSEYQKVISSFDIGFCLMASSHPSLLPFDLSGSGAVVVTNSFGVKDQAYFDTLTHGVIVGKPDVPDLVGALRKAVSRSSDLASRYAAARSMTFPRSWQDTFQSVHREYIKTVFTSCTPHQ